MGGRYKVISYKEPGGNPYVKSEADALQVTQTCYLDSINPKGAQYRSQVVVHYDTKMEKILYLHNNSVDIKPVEKAMKEAKTGKECLIALKKDLGDFHVVVQAIRFAVTGKIKDPNAPKKSAGASGGLSSLFKK